MSYNYQDCANMYAKRRAGLDRKRLTWCTYLWYDERRDCYVHHHHNTDTVFIYRDKYVVHTGGWNTVTTWKHIYDFVPICFGRVPSRLWVGNKFVMWNIPGNKRGYTEYYDGIELDMSGRPLDPQPIQTRRMRKGACDAFNALAKKVRHALALRTLVGEFDVVEDVAKLDELDVLNKMREVAARSEGLFAEFIPYDEVVGLFAQRETMSFGRVRGLGYMSSYEQPERNAKQRLQANINAAKRAWMWEQRRIGVEFFERGPDKEFA